MTAACIATMPSWTTEGLKLCTYLRQRDHSRPIQADQITIKRSNHSY